MPDQVDVDGLRISYDRAGAGPVVALAHGFVSDAVSTWGPQIEALSRDFTVIAWDLPGAGGSSDPPAWFRVADYADCWASFLRTLGFTRAHLVGLSVGGIIALSTTDRHPALPLSLSLVGAYAGWRGSLPAQEVEERLSRCMRVSELPSEQFAQAMVPSMFSRNAPEPLVQQFSDSVARFRPDGFRVISVASADADLRQALPNVRVPVLLIYGDQDVRAPLEVAEGIRAGIPHSHLAVLPGVGHVSPVEAPEAVSNLLVEFLRGV